MHRLVGVLVMAGCATLASLALAANGMLATAPLRMEVSALAIGEDGSVRIAPRKSTLDLASVDLYLVRIPSGPPNLRYLSPGRGWSTTPAPYRRFGEGAFAPVGATWHEDGPPGFITVLALFTRPGANPAARQSWVYQPLMARARLRLGEPSWTGAGRTLGFLGLATVVGLALVVALPRWPTAQRRLAR